MRRLLLSILGLCGLGLVGCHHVCSHGACDCEFDDHCCTRAPYIHYGAPVIGVTPVAPVAPVTPIETVPAPTKQAPKGTD
jgi:hypothetical protein